MITWRSLCNIDDTSILILSVWYSKQHWEAPDFKLSHCEISRLIRRAGQGSRAQDFILIAIGGAWVSASESIWDHQRRSLTWLIWTADDYGVIVGLNVEVCFSARRVELKVVAIMEGEDKSETIPVEVLRVAPFLGQEVTENVTLWVFDHENRLSLVGYLAVECEGTIAVFTWRV